MNKQGTNTEQNDIKEQEQNTGLVTGTQGTEHRMIGKHNFMVVMVYPGQNDLGNDSQITIHDFICPSWTLIVRSVLTSNIPEAPNQF